MAESLASAADPPRVRIYQLLPRLFGNTNETRKPNGFIEENGVGKFSDLNAGSLGAIRELGFTHVWLTGVLQQATSTDYSAIGEPADDPDLLKGLAGSPYAIKDYFDVCPDYAEDPAARLDEFRAVVERVHAAGMKVLIDFVPNHVARSYASSIRPDLSFGADDDQTQFFAAGNNFFWLTKDANASGDGPPLRLPTVDSNGNPTSPTAKVAKMPSDGLFEPEAKVGRVTGNDIVSWEPDAGSWYETVKLNYGFDFTGRASETKLYPHAEKPDLPIPDTWRKMDEIIAYWQGLGVDGFRCDMAHMVPPEFWDWMIARARERNADVFFAAEAYDTDPAKVGERHVTVDLLEAGFDAVYDDETYDKLKEIYDGGAWANDLDRLARPAGAFDSSLRYAENHDEVRLAGKGQWGGVGMEVGRPASALLFALSRGPVMLYSGQEVGEPADGVEGFGGDDARTSIFDYWSMPEFAKWVNGGKFDGGRLSPEQAELREFYGRLIRLMDEPAFRNGDFVPLNSANEENADYGRLPGETASGHWFYAFLRRDAASGQTFLVAINLHPTEALRDVRIELPEDVSGGTMEDRLSGGPRVEVTGERKVVIGDVPPLTSRFYEIAR